MRLGGGPLVPGGERVGVRVPPGPHGGGDDRVRVTRLRPRRGQHQFRAGRRATARATARGIGRGAGQRLLVQLVRRRPVPAAQDRRDGPHVRRCRHRPSGGRRRDATVNGVVAPAVQRAGPQPLPGLLVGVQVEQQRGRAARPQPQLLADPVPGQGGVADGRRCRTGQRQVRQTLAPVQLELAGDVDGEWSRGRRGGAQPGEDGLRLQRVGELDDVRGVGAGEHGGRHGREHGKHGGGVHQAPPAHGRRREQQHGSGHVPSPCRSRTAAP